MSRPTTMTVTRAGVALGALVEGVDLRRPLDESTADRIRAELDEHQVLVFPAQHLDDEQQLAVASLFGVPGGTEPFRTIDPDHTPVVKVQARGPGSPAFTDEWHSDISFSPTPPIVGTLSAVVVPRIGGDTAFVSLYGVYDALSEPLRALCSGLFAEHSWELIRHDLVEPRGAQFVAAAEAMFPPFLHPLVRTHPRTGRQYVYISAAATWLRRIVGLHPAEGAVLLEYLRRRLDDIELQFRWRWSVGDLVVWEQQTTNHMGMSDHMAVDPYRTVRSVWAYAEPPRPVLVS